MPAPAAAARRRPEPVPRTFRWTRARYDAAVAAGVLTPDDKIELLDGHIITKMPQGKPHRSATLLVGAALRETFAGVGFVQEEKPVALSDGSEPEPDVAVVRGTIRDYLNDHPGPDALLLLVEVAESSLGRDRALKAALYARARVADYWIVNLADATLEVHRDPAPDGAYRTKTTLGPDDAVAPLARPDARIPVADLLP